MPEEFFKGKAITITSRQYKNFLAKIDKKESGCWEWLGFIDKDGYGGVGIYSKGVAKHYRSHRLSYLLFVGEIPLNYHIDHICKKRSCLNPTHLEPVTPAENVNRSDSLTNLNKLKTHCPRGHEYAGENLYVDRNNKRSCKSCLSIRDKEYKAKRRKENV